MSTVTPSPITVVRDFVCTACGCACDDLALTIEGNRVVSFEPPCSLAEETLFAEHPSTVESAGLAAAVDQAARLLGSARAPLVMGFERATVQAQKLAVEIADRLGGFLDPTDERGASRSHAAVQTLGAVTATLGEVTQRSDLIVYWECDPAATHPRHLERFASRPGQRTVVIDAWQSWSSALADDRLLISLGSGYEGLLTLRALIKEIAIDSTTVEQRTGISVDLWRQLAEKLKSSRYAAIFYELPPAASRNVSAPAPGVSDATIQAITELVRDLHRHTRAVAMSLGTPYNAAGAAQVLTWQTGFPAAVSFASGYPQHLPDKAMAARLLARGEVDAALIIGADPLPHLGDDAAAHLRSIPTIVLDDRDTATMRATTVAIRTAPFDVATTGDVFRSDGVALPLRAAVRSALPSAEDVLAQLSAALVAQPASSPA
jgi:formylmethanofuran dehydrogenase subunit B